MMTIVTTMTIMSIDIKDNDDNCDNDDKNDNLNHPTTSHDENTKVGTASAATASQNSGNA